MIRLALNRVQDNIFTEKLVIVALAFLTFLNECLITVNCSFDIQVHSQGHIGIPLQLFASVAFWGPFH